jgi:hypothetical protein
MSSNQTSRPEAIPEDLRHLIHLNTTYCVLSCVECKKAVRPGALVEHLKSKHQVAWEVCKRVEGYIKGFRHDYKCSTIRLPDNGSAPQPLLPITSRFTCKKCEVWSSSNKGACWAHGNMEHGLRWTGFKDMFQKVDMQAWSRCRQPQYWVVVEGTESGTGGRSARPEPSAAEIKAIRQRQRRRGRRQRQRMTGIRVQEGGGGSAVIESEKATREVIVDRGKRGQSAAAADSSRPRRVRFDEQVWGLEGSEALKQQLDRWLKECIVCQLVTEEQAGPGRIHTIWECQQEAAEWIRVESKHMDCRMREVQTVVAAADQGWCGQCRVPQAMCGRWQWDQRQGQWVEDRTSRCQYKRVLIPAMMAIAELGKAEGRRRVGAWLRGDGVDPRGEELEVCRWFSKSVQWEGVKVQQAVVVLMMLARLNKVGLL